MAPPSISFAAMSQRQRALAQVILEDPDVESLSSFIGIDGVNMTTNSGRFLINLKPHGRRSTRAIDVGRRLTKATELLGIELYLSRFGFSHRFEREPHPISVSLGRRRSR